MLPTQGLSCFASHATHHHPAELNSLSTFQFVNNLLRPRLHVTYAKELIVSALLKEVITTNVQKSVKHKNGQIGYKIEKTK